MLGNRIILTPDRGIIYEGIVNAGETFYPGMAVQEDPVQATQGNRKVCKIYAPGTTGNRPVGPHIIVQEDLKQGRTVNDPYTAGERFVGWIPWAGCRLNLLFRNVAGTADDVAIGSILVPNTGTGKWDVTTGTPQTGPARSNEALVDPVADTLLECVWTGY
jgi:hypothetical protein